MNVNKETGEMYGVFMRTAYNYDTNLASDETALICEKETLTQQQFKEESDINTIVEKFMRSGETPPPIEWPDQVEFMETFDYQTAMNVTVKARESFMELPAKARARFENDPQRFMEFMENPDNQDEAIKLGMAVRRAEPQRTEEKEKE